MGRRLGLWLIWLAFLVNALLFAPPLPPTAFQPLQTLLAGQIPSLNPVLISLFSMIGIWLLIYSSLSVIDGRMQTLSATGFMLASAATGVLALIPYLAWREPNQQFSGPKDFWIKLFDARSTGIILTTSTILLLGYALLFGDWAGFADAFQTNRFVYAMSLAFGLLCLLFPYPTLLQDDMSRRGLTSNSQLFWLVALIPLFGPLLYLCIRPPLL